MKQDDWLKRLERHMAGYRERPSRDLWEGIEAALDKQARKKARVVAFRRWMAAAAIMGLMAGGAVLFWNKEPENHSVEAVAEAAAHNTPIILEKAPETNYERSSKDAVHQTQEGKPQETTLPNHEENPMETTNPNHENSPTDPVHQTHESLPVAHPKQDIPHPAEDPLPTIRQQHQHRRLSMNLYASGGTNGWKGRNGVEMSPSYLQQFSMTRTSDAKAYLVGFEERQSHDFPIAFGLTLSYPLTGRLAISTGVAYTKLSSDFLTMMPSHQMARHQTLHYVGVPLNLQYAIWQWHGLSVYLAAGGEADWNVKAQANTDGVDQEMDKDRMQWSVGGSLGLQYDFIPHLGIYVEPGIRHYFDNGSHVSNFFKDKPTDFHLQLGLRFRFD